ncbi:TatD family hydrolase [Phocea massiliensis]|uniref:TatD family hydrolase n=1 Tax=Merdimmobilis hominis TaxID=2897707 RepID=A0A939BFA5_9FIRM|nr:TatD family hydrolase [Merdimmobilis hominis]MBM6921897.1 TatD family hydrolase [Merdimmobilis hominis]
MVSGIFDSHAHYDDERFRDDLPDVISHLTQNGVCAVLNVGCDEQSSLSTVSLAKQIPWFYAAVGIHPHAADELSEHWMDTLMPLFSEEKVVALGEIGLDYHWDTPDRESQRTLFEAQLQLAQQVNLPVIIHSRDACADTMELLHKYNPCGVVHCFSGSAETAKEVVNMGMYVGFTGVVTFPNARKTLEAVRAVPMERLLLETDCPYMAPVPFRGKRTTSDMIQYTAQAIAEQKGLSAQEVIDIARENTCRLFGISL